MTITYYTIQSSKIKTELKIVLLTDLHSCSYGDKQTELIEAIHRQEPDIVMMSGDIADDVLPDYKVKQLLDGIGDRYPCYYVTGNHEFWSNRVDEQKDMFRSYGVNVLEGTGGSITLNGQIISVYGVDDPDGGLERFESQLTAVGSSIIAAEYSILLSHRPELFESYADYNFDLVLSGHAHGGQWRVPVILPNGLLAPNQGFFPQYTCGIHTSGLTKMIVSRGLSRESTRIPRFYNPSELVVISLISENTDTIDN